MKEELEDTLLQWLKTLEYDGEQIAENFIRGRANKPEGNSFIIADFNNPIAEKPREHRLGNNKKLIKGTGKIICIWKAIDEEGSIIEGAEEFNDKIPDLIADTVFDDPTLGNLIPGEIIIIKQESGYIQTQRLEDNYPFITVLTFEYKGLWVTPIIE
ncbi:MAG: hypothetical protein QHH15_00210 [Candidatus Thermoplasmatota archaeon]|nr:hypothetical protein [Candidatus Thermoplasmatota archaeon]